MPRTTDLFVDTAGWLSSWNHQDQYYPAFATFLKHVQTTGQHLVTTNYVIAELVSLLSKSRFHLSRQKLIKLIQDIKTDPRLEIVYIEQSIDTEAWELLEMHLDKEWSLVDASSFVVMKRFGLTQALTTDRHFAQAGFIRVPML